MNGEGWLRWGCRANTEGIELPNSLADVFPAHGWHECEIKRVPRAAVCSRISGTTSFAE